jgi:hypothetical protein
LAFAVNGEVDTSDKAKPGSSNTGVPEGYERTPATTDDAAGVSVASNGNVSINKAGTFEGLLITGRLKINADDVTIRYSRIEGMPNPSDLTTDPVSYDDCVSLSAPIMSELDTI